MNNEHDTLAAIKQYLDAEMLTWVCDWVMKLLERFSA